MAKYSERQAPILLPANLIADLWSFVKEERDAAHDTVQRHDRIQKLLSRMEVAGMANHLPTIEEVQAAWRGDEL